MPRARASGRRLTREDASLVKGMVARGDRHHDVAAWFGVNQGRIAEVNNRDLHASVPMASQEMLPPPGPYTSGRAGHAAIVALEEARTSLNAAKKTVDATLKAIREGKL